VLDNKSYGQKLPKIDVFCIKC